MYNEMVDETGGTYNEMVDERRPTYNEMGLEPALTRSVGGFPNVQRDGSRRCSSTISLYIAPKPPSLAVAGGC